MSPVYFLTSYSLSISENYKNIQPTITLSVKLRDLEERVSFSYVLILFSVGIHEFHFRNLTLRVIPFRMVMFSTCNVPYPFLNIQLSTPLENQTTCTVAFCREHKHIMRSTLRFERIFQHKKPSMKQLRNYGTSVDRKLTSALSSLTNVNVISTTKIQTSADKNWFPYTQVLNINNQVLTRIINYVK